MHEHDLFAPGGELNRQREALQEFKERYSAEKPTGGKHCLGRLLEVSSCFHRTYSEDTQGEIPHEPPYVNESTLWLRDGEPRVYVCHPNLMFENYREEIESFAEEHGLDVEIDPMDSFYNPDGAVMVVFSRRE